MAEQRRPRLPPLPDRPERPRAILGTPEFAPEATKKPLTKEAEFWLRGRVMFINTMAKANGQRVPIDDGCSALLTVLMGFARRGNYAPTQEQISRKLFSKASVRAIRDRTERLERCGLIRVQPTWMSTAATGRPENDAHYYLFCLDGLADEQAIAPDGENDTEKEHPHHPKAVANPDDVEEVVAEPVCAICPVTGNVCSNSKKAIPPSVLLPGGAAGASPQRPAVETFHSRKAPPGLAKVPKHLQVEVYPAALVQAAIEQPMLRRFEDLLLWHMNEVRRYSTTIDLMKGAGRPMLTARECAEQVRWDSGLLPPLPPGERSGLEEDAAKGESEQAAAWKAEDDRHDRKALRQGLREIREAERRRQQPAALPAPTRTPSDPSRC